MVLRNQQTPPRRRFLCLACLALACGAEFVGTAEGKGGRLRLRVVDKKTQLPMAARIHLETIGGKPKRIPGAPFLHDHGVVEGDAILELPVGEYRFRIECGLEYLEGNGGFYLAKEADDTHTVELERFVDMSKDNWWSGDLWVARNREQMPLLMEADDLHFAACFEPTSKSVAAFPQTPAELQENYWLDVTNQAFNLSGGSLLFHRMAKPLLPPVATAKSSWHSGELIVRASPKGSKLGCIADLASWDLPVWIASQRIASAVVLGPETLGEAWIKSKESRRPWDSVLFPPPHSSGRWREHIYYQLLECGLQIPPVAASASGESNLPVGSNRVYAHLSSVVSATSWWDAVQEGKVVITNGPLMNPKVNGQAPGHVFKSPAGVSVRLEPELTLRTREPIAYLEIIKNGRTAHSISLQEWKDRSGRLPVVDFSESGWMAIRAVTDNPDAYRFAMSGPFYVQVGDQPRISRRAVDFFLEWEAERIKPATAKQATAQKDLPGDVERRFHDATVTFWERLKQKANTP
jgi:hypothetical protein